jgi:nitrite reductase/ring-hydroxylating ferredoxin subunit
MRRLPVIQPTALERRAFLLGLFGTAAAACSAEPEPLPRRGGGAGGTGQPSADGGGGDGGGAASDAGIRADGSRGSDGSSGADSGGGGEDSGSDAAASTCATSGVDCGPPSSFAMGTLTYVSAVPVFIGRDANGLYAMHPLCTHTIGNLNLSNGQLVCAVHGARFSLTGDVLQGPATQPLPHFAMCLKSNGNVAVDNRVAVPSTTRLKA